MASLVKHQKKIKKEKGGGIFIRLGQAIGAAGMNGVADSNGVYASVGDPTTAQMISTGCNGGNDAASSSSPSAHSTRPFTTATGFCR